jgi:hypothetical protein
MPARQPELWLTKLDIGALHEQPLAQLHALAAQLHSEREEPGLLSGMTPKAGLDHTGNTIGTGSTARDATISAAHALCRAYLDAVERAALFSVNEELDDVATPSLKHLLAPFYLADVLMACSPLPEDSSSVALSGGRGRAVGGSVQGRRACLVREAASAYDAFLGRCGTCRGLMGIEVQRLLDQAEELCEGPAEGAEQVRFVIVCVRHARHRGVQSASDEGCGVQEAAEWNAGKTLQHKHCYCCLGSSCICRACTSTIYRRRRHLCPRAQAPAWSCAATARWVEGLGVRAQLRKGAPLTPPPSAQPRLSASRRRRH